MASAEAATDDPPAHMSKALHDFLAAEEEGDDDDPAPDSNGDNNDDDNDAAGDGLELGEVDISTGGGASLAGLEQQLDRLSDHPVLRAILDQVAAAARTDAVLAADQELHSSYHLIGKPFPRHHHTGSQVLHLPVSATEDEAV